MHLSAPDSHSFTLQHTPLLDQPQDHVGLGDGEDDLERAERGFGESARCSVEMTSLALEENSPGSGASWKALSQKPISFLSNHAVTVESFLGYRREHRSKRSPVWLRLFVLFSVVLCLVQIVIFSIHLISLMLATLIPSWRGSATPSASLLPWPANALRDIQPVPCHSHNDYWRKYPLYSALHAGCTSVEADIWLVDDNDNNDNNELYVGHSLASLTTNRTLTQLYITPLLAILADSNPTTKFHPNPDSPPNGVFPTDPTQTLVLLLDFKTAGPALWPHVSAHLAPLRQAGYLTYWDGDVVHKRPITAVGTGNTPFDLVTSNSSYRDIFFDAPLDRLGPSSPSLSSSSSLVPLYDHSNSYYASTSLRDQIGMLWSEPSAQQRHHLHNQIGAAHDRGLKARYWETPAWPKGLRDRVWNVLVREGVDVLNVDDLQDATAGSWGEWGGMGIK